MLRILRTLINTSVDDRAASQASLFLICWVLLESSAYHRELSDVEFDCRTLSIMRSCKPAPLRGHFEPNMQHLVDQDLVCTPNYLGCYIFTGNVFQWLVTKRSKAFPC